MSYLPNNLIESITYGNGIKTIYSYDSDQNISHLLTVTNEGEKLQDFTYQYDLNGNRLSKVGLNQDTHFAYDNMNRLIKANYNERTENFTYDLVGNRLSHSVNDENTTFIYNTKNQLTQLSKDLGITNFTYDAQGNILKESTPQGTTTFSYNALNQQTKVVTHKGNTLINHYDAEGLRTEIEENQRLTRFIFHRDEVLVETDQEDQVISRLLRGYDVVAGDVADIENGTASNGLERYYYQLDEQFSTSFITNQAQKVVNSYTYDAFGNTLESQEKVHNRIRYTGQQYDTITQQYYLRARFYNPILGRFIQEDIYRDDGLNLYAYCDNNPVMYYDPSGYSNNTNHPNKEDVMGQSGNKGGKKTSSLPEWLKEKFEAGNNFNKENRPNYPYNEVEVYGKKKYVVDSYVPGKEIVSRKYTQLANVKESTGKGYLNELKTKYPSGAIITDSPFNPKVLRGQEMTGQLILEIPVQNNPIPQSVIDYANDNDIVIRDVERNVYN